MSVSVSYPGVYIQELPSSVHTIVGVATSIAAFVDAFTSGPLNEAVQIFNFAQFEQRFGGLAPGSEASYAIQQFFVNGGTNAYVVRVTAGTGGTAAVAAAIGLQNQAGGTVQLVATANGPGAWGSFIRLDVDYGTAKTGQFNLIVTEVASTGATTAVVAKEVYLNLVVNAAMPNDAVSTVNAASQLITLALGPSAAVGTSPAQTGTASKAIVNAVTSFSTLNIQPTDTITVSLNGSATAVGTTAALGASATDLTSLAAALQTQIQAAANASGVKVAPNATVSVVGSASGTAYLVAKANTANPADILNFSDASANGLAAKLGFTSANSNVQQYALGGTLAGAQAVPPAANQAVAGSDGSWDPTKPPSQWSTQNGIALGLIGDPNLKTGIYALLDVDLFNILCIPATFNLTTADAAEVATFATALCQTRRAMYLLDVPGAVADTVPAIIAWLDNNASLRNANAALYFPHLDIPDPLNQLRLRKMSPSGTIAGLWARTDGTRGVWKAPAGTAATLTNVPQLEYKLTDPENGVLNPLAINCLRSFPIFGQVCWGARTLNGADQMADQWKYLPIRRLALYIEESLYRGTQWVVFEPNDTPLWAQIRLNVGAFMQTLFRQGAFQGSTPAEAYFVACDATTNPQASINQGIVNIVVGFAPLVPAEFVVISIQQLAGQLGT
jgi:phage tail sheath protein FI